MNSKSEKKSGTRDRKRGADAGDQTWDPLEETTATLSLGESRQLGLPADEMAGRRWAPVLYRVVGRQPSDFFPMKGAEANIGRGPINEVVFADDNAVSYKHAAIRWENWDRPGEYPTCTLEDVGSSNGTMLNDHRLEKCERIVSGDRFVVGGTVVAFMIKEIDDLALDRQYLRLAVYDSLTGLPNRRAFLKHANLRVEEAVETHEPLALLLVDVDRYKIVNENYGHTCGDAVLRRLARLMFDNFHDSDIIGRLGGEDFAVLMPGVSRATALEAAERLRRAVDAHPFRAGEEKIDLSVSIGVATVSAKTNAWSDLYQGAAKALYAAKEAGRNQVRPE